MAKTKLSKDCSCSDFNFLIFASVATTDRMASLASFSAAITELQLKITHNVIVLSHSLCSLIGPTKNLSEKTKVYSRIPDVVLKENEIERKYVGGRSQANLILLNERIIPLASQLIVHIY